MKKVKIYISDSSDIYTNLALEEYFVTESDEDILLFYVNTDAVVIGKHQNPWKEVDLTSITNTGKPHKVARRLSGGGTVFHDIGNINFSFIRNKDVDFVNFREHIEPISIALSSLGIPNEISLRNDIFVQNHKVSGNAEHVNSRKKRILHHGTLLYDSDLIRLNGSIRAKEKLTIETHAVDSVRSPVMNMRDIQDLGNTPDFLSTLTSRLQYDLGIEEISNINPENINDVNELVANKYIRWEWIFGHTPSFKYTDDKGNIYKIKKGTVEEAELKQHLGKKFSEIL